VCEYCGCQDIPAIAQLTEEHDRALGHVRDAEAAGRCQDLPAARAAGAALAALLAPHSAIEEQGLFPAMAAEHPEHVRTLLAEHELVERTLAELAQALPEPGWPDRLRRALTVLREHIHKEQDGLFPAALTILTGDDWDALDRLRAQLTGATTGTTTLEDPRMVTPSSTHGQQTGPAHPTVSARR
jgi:Hemerythrin HHE cation binding domain